MWLHINALSNVFALKIVCTLSDIIISYLCDSCFYTKMVSINLKVSSRLLINFFRSGYWSGSWTTLKSGRKSLNFSKKGKQKTDVKRRSWIWTRTISSRTLTCGSDINSTCLTVAQPPIPGDLASWLATSSGPGECKTRTTTASIIHVVARACIHS